VLTISDSPPSRERDAEQANNVAVVGVEKLSGGGAVDANFVDLCRVGAGILDVPKYVSQTILRHEITKIRAQTHVCHSALVVAPFLDWEPLEQDEALAIQKFVSH